jgi:hypothetical protein
MLPWPYPPTAHPEEERIVNKPDFGRAIVGRGAVNQTGPEATVHRIQWFNAPMNSPPDFHLQHIEVNSKNEPYRLLIGNSSTLACLPRQ